MRGALAHEIGSPEKAVGAGRNFGSFGGEVVVGCDRAGGIDGERVAEPAQGEAGSLGHAHHMPPAGNGVAKGVHTAAGIERGAIGDGKNYTRGADGGADGARRDDAHAHSTGSLIASTCNDRSADGEDRKSTRLNSSHRCISY